MDCNCLKHTNVFITMNGMPYIVGEYADETHYQQLDPSMVKDEIIIDDSEAMRTVIDISVDDIGRVPSTGRLNVIGNRTQFENMLELIRRNYRQLDHVLPMLKRSLVITVNYQLENARTGIVMRSAVEKLRIPERYFFFVVNPDDVDDNAIVCNFSDSIVSTINQFTHGTEPMRFRITSMQLSYECLRQDPLKPRVRKEFSEDIPVYQGPAEYATNQDIYNYHKKMQSRHSFGGCYAVPQQGNYYMFSTFYHFDEMNDSIILHQEEINDRHNKVWEVPCGQIQINRTFQVNPGSRIVFKFSIWKNDCILSNSAKPVAEALNPPFIPYCPERPCPPPPVPPCPPPPCPQPYYPYPYPYPPRDREFDLIMKLFEMEKKTNDEQEGEIKAVAASLKELADYVHHHPQPPTPPGPHPPHPHPGPIDKLYRMLKKLQKQVDEIEEDDDEIVPITNEEIDEIVNSVEADWNDNWAYDDSVVPPIDDDDDSDDDEGGEGSGEITD